MNSVRSPMAEALAREALGGDVRVESCGVHEGVLDPFAAEVLEEAGVPRPSRAPQDFGRVAATDFDVVIALTGEAAGEARRAGADPEFWDTENPTEARGDREHVLTAYRRVRDALRRQIEERFAR